MFTGNDSMELATNPQINEIRQFTLVQSQSSVRFSCLPLRGKQVTSDYTLIQR